MQEPNPMLRWVGEQSNKTGEDLQPTLPFQRNFICPSIKGCVKKIDGVVPGKEPFSESTRVGIVRVGV